MKYESYIDSLQGAMALRLKKRGEKALERALHGVVEDPYGAGKGKWRGRPEGPAILEDEEAAGGGEKPTSHRRESAEMDDASLDSRTTTMED